MLSYGHLQLSRAQAQAHQFPAIDVLPVSRE